MATTLTNFTSETQLGTSESTLLSTSTSERKFIGRAVFTNTSASNVEVTVWLLDDTTTGTTGSGGNWLEKKTIPAGRAWLCDKLIGQALNPSMKVSALAGTGSVMNANISGTTEV